MNRRVNRYIGILIAAFLLLLASAPVALCASHDWHSCSVESCHVCAAIRDDLMLLRILASVSISIYAFLTALTHARDAALRESSGFIALLPVELKVRMNN